MHKNVIALFAALVALVSPSTAAAQDDKKPSQVRLLGSPILKVNWRSGTGDTVIQLRNNGKEDVLCLLTASVTGGSKGSHTAITFLDDEHGSRSTGDVTLRPAATTPIRLSIAGAFDTNESEASIGCDGGVELGKLKLSRAAFNITRPNGQTDPIDLSLVDQQPARIPLKNDDPVAYPVAWKLVVEGHELGAGEITVQPKGQAILQWKPLVAFRTHDLFKRITRDGELLLFDGQLKDHDAAAPVKSFPVKATLSYFNPSFRDGLSYLFIVLVLTLGGISSLLLTHALPNRLEALNIKERLSALARTTADLSNHIDTRVAVLVRIERTRLADLLRSRTIISPDFANILEQCRQGMSKLSSRVGLLQQIDLVFEQLAKLTTRTLAPSRVDEIVVAVQRAQVLLGKAEPSDADLQAALTATELAAKKLDTLTDSDTEFEQKLIARVQAQLADVGIRLEKSPTFVRMNSAVPGPVATLRSANSGNVPTEGYAAVDMALEKVRLMTEYTDLVDGTTDGPMLERLQKHERALLGSLQLPTLMELKSARLLMRQMKDDIYSPRIEEAVRAKDVSIGMDPRIAYERSPLEFCICFHNAAVNTSAAREEWTCEWDFGDDMQASGWTVSHYYQFQTVSLKEALTPRSPKRFTVRATLRNREGRTVLDPETKLPIIVERVIEVRPTKVDNVFGERTRVEVMKLAAALLVAVFALVSGASEQVQKLDLLPAVVAVFLVGFGADTIKNLLTAK